MLQVKFFPSSLFFCHLLNLFTGRRYSDLYSLSSVQIRWTALLISSTQTPTAMARRSSLNQGPQHANLRLRLMLVKLGSMCLFRSPFPCFHGAGTKAVYSEILVSTARGKRHNGNKMLQLLMWLQWNQLLHSEQGMSDFC